MAAGQAGAALHDVGVAGIPGWFAEGTRPWSGDPPPPEAVTELRRTTDLALKATKQTAAAIG